MSKSYIKWLKQTIAEMQEHAEMFPGDIDTDHGKVLKALRIALASLEASSRKLFTCSACGAEGLDEPLESKCHCCIDGAHWVESRVYTAPPAPVLPVEISDIIKRFQYQADHLSDWHHIDEHSCKVNRRDLMTVLEFLNSCRAAMINGVKS